MRTAAVLPRVGRANPGGRHGANPQTVAHPAAGRGRPERRPRGPTRMGGLLRGPCAVPPDAPDRLPRPAAVAAPDRRGTVPAGRRPMMLTGVVARYVDAWNAHDAAACGESFAPEGERIWLVFAPSHLSGDPFPRFAGRAEVAWAIGDFMRSVPDLRVDVTAFS